VDELSIPTDQGRAQDDAGRLIDFLRSRDAPCPQCGYNLRDLTSPRCPECGQLLQLSVTLVEPYLKAWIALSAVMCAGAGLGTLWLVIIVMEGWPGPFPGKVAVAMHIAMIPLAAIVVVKRRPFLKQRREVQWRVAWLGIAAFVVTVIVFVAALR
jgi:hypothetical protein